MLTNMVDVWGYRLIKEDLGLVSLDSKVLINTISPNSYGLAVNDQRAEKALKGADCLVLDGWYFGLAPFFFKGKWIKRITGWDCFQFFSKKMNETRGRVFFLGSSEDTLQKIKERCAQEFPMVEVGTYSPPFKPEFSKEDNEAMHQAINDFEPDVVFVGMTAPKQEIWGFENKEFLDTHIICGIGNVFDWYAGNAVRPHVFWQKIGLEWFVRIFHRPEIFKRNIANQMIFFRDLLLVMLRMKRL